MRTTPTIPIKRKLLAYLHANNITKNQFYLAAGLANGFLDKDRGFNTDFLQKILIAYPDMDAEWLLFGDDLYPRKSKEERILQQNSTAVEHTLRLNAETIHAQSEQIGKLINLLNDEHSR